MELAAFWRSFGWSANFILHMMFDEIVFRNDGDYFDYNEIYIDLNNADIWKDFGEDPVRAMNAFLQTADHKLSRMVRESKLRQIMWLDLAKKTYEARSQG